MTTGSYGWSVTELGLKPNRLAPKSAFSTIILPPSCLMAITHALLIAPHRPACYDLILVNNGLQSQLQIRYLGVMSPHKLMKITFTDPSPDIPLLHVFQSTSPWEEKPHLSASSILQESLEEMSRHSKNVPFTLLFLAHTLSTHFNDFLFSTILSSPKGKSLTHSLRSN